jgi:hypothetical protein
VLQSGDMYGMGVEKICENAGKWQKGAEKESSFSSGVVFFKEN